MKLRLISLLLSCWLSGCAQIPHWSIASACDSLFNGYSGKPGVAVLIVQDGKIAFEKGYGLANLEDNLPITSATVFDIASVSKQFTGYAISTLIQQGKLSPGDDIHKYLPDIPDFGKKITIGHLIHHSSGLRDWPEVLHYAGWHWDEGFGWEEILRMVRLQKDLDFEPGSQYAYSNTDYNLLAAVVERVTGKSFPVWVQEHVFTPLQMQSSLVLTDYSTVIPHVAGSYDLEPDGYHHSRGTLTAWGSSSIFTTAEDLAKWVIAFNKGLDEKNPVYTRMIQTDTLNGGKHNEYAYGLQVRQDAGLPNIMHTGLWPSFHSVVSTYPSEKISIILLSNNGEFKTTATAGQVARALFANKFKRDNAPKQMDRGSQPPAPGPTPVKPDKAELQTYTGSYYSPELEATYRLYVDSGRLKAHFLRLGDFELTPEPGQADQFSGPDNSHFAFDRDTTRRITGLRLSGGRIRNIRFEKKEQ